jgi:hypothetical protein
VIIGRDLYRVGACPTIDFAYPGGILAFEEIGTLSAAMLNADIKRLLRHSRERAGEGR